MVMIKTTKLGPGVSYNNCNYIIFVSYKRVKQESSS